MGARFTSSALVIFYINFPLFFLIFRSCNLERDDAESLRHALNCMPNLDSLDLSDNPIEDGVG